MSDFPHLRRYRKKEIESTLGIPGLIARDKVVVTLTTVYIRIAGTYWCLCFSSSTDPKMCARRSLWTSSWDLGYCHEGGTSEDKIS